MPQYELAAVGDKGEDANHQDDRGGTPARNARIKRVAIIVGAVLLGVLVIILLIWGIRSLLFGQQDHFFESIPGINYRTNSSEDGLEHLIWIHTTSRDSHLRWTDAISNALKPYKYDGQNMKENLVICSYDKKPAVGKACYVDMQNWRPCTPSDYYGYHRGAPCVFLKFKQISNWIPEFYNSTSQLPENMPEYLQHKITELLSIKSLKNEINTVWVTCDGHTDVDEENIGPIRYMPTQGFPGYYFPYQEQEGYLSPLVAVQFERPSNGIIISVICRLWAPNIHHEKGEGQIGFMLLID